MLLREGSYRIAIDDGTGFLTSLSHRDDPRDMNWIEGARPWGEEGNGPAYLGKVTSPDDSGGEKHVFSYQGEGYRLRVERYFLDGRFHESYGVTNVSGRSLIIGPEDFGICTPFNDSYDGGEKTLTNRCHAHIWCGLSTSYVCALRMGGGDINLGLILTEGRLGSYSIERETASNDRGDIILHPPLTALGPDQTFTLGWDLIWHGGKEDFREVLRSYPGIVLIDAPRFTLFPGEVMSLEIQPPLPGAHRVDVDGEEQAIHGGSVQLPGREEGFHRLTVKTGDRETEAVFHVSSPVGRLAEERCRFIRMKQQFPDSPSPLSGAYLTYDGETGRLVHSHRRMDTNSARERLGMGVLAAKQLQRGEDPDLRESLEKYLRFVYREIFDSSTGEVFNDLGYDGSYRRLYNYPWVALLLLEIYALKGDGEILTHLYRCLRSYYAGGGDRFYSIGLPALRSYRLFLSRGRAGEAEEVARMFRTHADHIRGTGLNYPPHEVSYEQSIVAPAADYLLQQYGISGEDPYLEEAEKHLAALELFNGFQPDCRLRDIAIRHWDGYWFGKRRLYGDTFPHYWSVLTANVFLSYSELTGKNRYRERAENIYRNNLCLFSSDGRASCAYLYPYKVNGINGEYFDPYANDQDWALYYALDSNLFC